MPPDRNHRHVAKTRWRSRPAGGGKWNARLVNGAGSYPFRPRRERLCLDEQMMDLRVSGANAPVQPIDGRGCLRSTEFWSKLDLQSQEYVARPEVHAQRSDQAAH